MIVADARWNGAHGIGRFTKEILKYIPEIQPVYPSIRPLHPLEPYYLTGWLLYHQPSCYYTPGFNPPAFSPKPFIFSIYDLIHLHFAQEATTIKKYYYSNVVKPAIKNAYCVFTSSNFSKNEIVQWASIDERQICVVGAGVGLEFNPGGDKYLPGYPYFLYVGTRKIHKNLPRLLRAFAFSNINQSIKLVLTGNPDDNLMGIIKNLGIETRVKFAGIIPDQMLPSYYRGAIALVFPSLYEGFGLPPLEAMACGTPVITSNVTSLPEVVSNAGLLIDPLDVEEIAFAMQSLAEDSAMRAELSEKGLARAQLFSWNQTANLIWDVLNEASKQS